MLKVFRESTRPTIAVTPASHPWPKVKPAATQQQATRIIICAVVVTTFACGAANAQQPIAQVASPSPAEMGTNPRALYLAAETVDLTNAPSLHNAPGYRFDPTTYYVMQLDGPIDPARRAAIDAAGIVLRDYLPMYAYIVRGDCLSADVLRPLDFIRWIGEYRREWKLSPGLATPRAFETDERRQLAAGNRKRLTVELVRGADSVEAVRALSREADALNDIRPTHDRCKIELDIHSDRVAALVDAPDVLFISEAPEGLPRNATTTWIAQSNVLNSTPLWNAGLRGENQVVGLIDWGLDANHCAFNDTVAPGPTHRKLRDYVVAIGQAIPGAFGYHGTHVGGALAGDQLAETNADLRGMAYKAKIVMQHYAGLVTSTNVDERLQHAYDLGARIHSNSWGNNDTIYNAWCVDIDQFTHDNEENVVVIAILNGSSGSAPGSIRAPENAKNCLAVAASGDTPNQENHGSGARGPTADGRQKPEVWIPGCSVSANVSTACDSLLRACATSWASPVASGMAVLARQYFLEGFYPSGAADALDAFDPSGALVRAILINSAVDMSGFAGYFGTHEGWGRVLMDDALYFAGDARKLIVHDVRHADGLLTSEFLRFETNVTSSAQRLKITLVWSDAPAALSAGFTPVNDLDLLVTDPIGNVYKGNVFSGAESATGGVTDIRNNAEQVHRSNPLTGVWTVDVVGSAVSVGTQGFALVITGNVEPLVTCTKGDMNDDTLINGEDIGGFVAVLLGGGTPRELCAADVDEANSVDMDDVAPFVALLLSQP